jgi:hypothetical protein
MANRNGNGLSVDVLAERIANLSKKVDEQAVFAQTAITVALANQEKTTQVAFAASEKANSKSENNQSEINKVMSGDIEQVALNVSELTKDVISLRESRSQGVGDKSAKTSDKEQSNFDKNLAISIGFNVLMFLGMLWKMLAH